jgi:hypothetical protein
MTRRTTRASTVDDGDSVQENIGVTAQGKDVEVKQENAKKGKTRRVESDEEEDEPQAPSQPNGVDQDAEGDELEENDDEEEGTPGRRKRARVNSVGTSVPASPQRERVQTLPRDVDG